MDTTNPQTTETQATAPATTQGATSVPSQGANQKPTAPSNEAPQPTIGQSNSPSARKENQSQDPLEETTATPEATTATKEATTATKEATTATPEATREQSRPTPPPLPTELQQGKDPKALEETIQTLQQRLDTLERLERLIAGDEMDLWTLLPEALFLTQCRHYGVDTMWRLSVCKNVQVSLSLYI